MNVTTYRPPFCHLRDCDATAEAVSVSDSCSCVITSSQFKPRPQSSTPLISLALLRLCAHFPTISIRVLTGATHLWCFWRKPAVSMSRSEHQLPAALQNVDVRRRHEQLQEVRFLTPQLWLAQPAWEREEGNHAGSLTVCWSGTLWESLLRKKVPDSFGRSPSPHWNNEGQLREMRAPDRCLQRQQSVLTTDLINMNHDDANSL